MLGAVPVWMQRTLEMLTSREVLPFGGVGLGGAVVLLVMLHLTLPLAARRQLKFPLLLLLVHGVCVLLSLVLPEGFTGARVLALLGLFALLVALGKLTLLLVVDVLWMRRLSRPVPKIFRDILGGVVYAIAILATLRGAGAQLDSLLTTSALLTAVIGLSMQDTLSNVFAGLAIHAEHPFEVGDWIQYADDPRQTGKVIEINWRATKVVTLDDVEVVIPNGTLAKAAIRNFTKPSPVSRRCLYVTVPFRHPPHEVRKVLLEGLAGIRGVLPRPEPSVITDEIDERGIRYSVRVFTDDFTGREGIDAQVLERIWYALHRAGIPIAVPIHGVDLHQENDETRARAEASRVESRLQALRHVDFISALPKEQLETLARRVQSRLYAPGEIIIEEGDPGDELFILEQGEVAVILRAQPNHTVEVARLGEGSFFGEMSVMTGEHRQATVRALSPARLLVVPKQAFQQILESAPDLAEKISTVLAQRQHELQSSVPQSKKGEDKNMQEDRKVILSRIRDFFSLRP